MPLYRLKQLTKLSMKLWKLRSLLRRTAKVSARVWRLNTLEKRKLVTAEAVLEVFSAVMRVKLVTARFWRTVAW